MLLADSAGNKALHSLATDFFVMLGSLFDFVRIAKPLPTCLLHIMFKNKPN